MVTETVARDGIITARALTGYRDLLEERGCCPEKLMNEAGLEIDLLDTPEAMISFRAFAQLLETSAEETSYSDFGMRLAERQNSTDIMGPLAQLIRSAPTALSM